LIPSAVLRQVVGIEPYLGDSATGPQFGALQTVPGQVSTVIAQVIAGDRAEQIVANLTLGPDVECPANSRVTVDGESFTAVASTLVNAMARPFCRRVQLGRG